jgi:hypothetical protein
MDLKDRGCGLYLSGTGWGPVAGFFGHGNEYLLFINGGCFLSTWPSVSFYLLLAGEFTGSD